MLSNGTGGKSVMSGMALYLLSVKINILNRAEKIFFHLKKIVETFDPKALYSPQHFLVNSQKNVAVNTRHEEALTVF